jgi:GNAT superfamily N-acetyltransferase
MMLLSSRAATAADLELLAEMNEGLIRDEASRNPMQRGELRQRMATWLEGGAWRLDLFEAEGETVGYAAFRREREASGGPGEVLVVRQFYICPPHRRRGMGREAMLHLIQRRGGPGIACRLEVLETNPTGRLFWQALGFRAYATIMERPDRA